MSDKIRRAPHDTENPFAQISRLMLQDKTLSYEARGLLGYLLSKSGNWELRISDLQIKGAGRDKIYRILGELQAKGYIGGRKKYQDEKGYWQWTPYDVYETRELNPFTENPYTVNPHTENTEIKAVKKNTKQRERKTEEEKKEITTISASAESAVSPVNDWSLADEADDAAMFVPKGKKQISAQAEKGSKRLSKPTTTPTTPQPPAAPVADVQEFAGKLEQAKDGKAKRKPNRMAHIIDTAWRKTVSGYLLPQLMGKADKPDRKPYNLTPACTEAEIWSFCNWWRSTHPAHIQVPTKGNAVHDAMIEYRGLADYETRIADAEYDVGKMFPREDVTKVETPAAPMATPEQLAEVSANLARLMETFTRQDVS